VKKLWPDQLDKLEPEQLHALVKQLLPEFIQFLEQEKISASPDLIANFSGFYLPCAAWLADLHQNQTLVIGLNGAQGSGKSTLTGILATLLEKGFNKNVATLSIDDLYKTQEQRQAMAETIHPLFATRGVPGTHDIDMGLQLLSDLKLSEINNDIYIPRFNKLTDDRHTKEQWQKISSPVDIILFEGWCVSATSEHEDVLAEAINTLEENEDPDSTWRHHVNQQLAGPYQELFSHIDILLMLVIPDIKYIYEWRLVQEQKLKQSDSANDWSIAPDMELEHFIMNFERITRACLKEMPERADIALELDGHHQISKVRTKTD